MALKFISASAKHVPNYIALSTDIVNNKIDGAGMIGRLVYTTDNEKWYIITEDLTLVEISIPTRCHI